MGSSRQSCSGGMGHRGRGLWGPFLEKGHRRVSGEALVFIPAQGGEGSCCQQWALWADGSHLLVAAIQTCQVTWGSWVPARQPLPALPPPTVPGSLSHLGTLPRSLLTGWAALGLGSRGPTASSAPGWDSTGAESGAGGGDGVTEALDMHLGTK